MTNSYHATPYDLSAQGFYFETFDEYTERASSHRNAYGQPVEEYEIQFIDGDNCALFAALGINQANLEIWFDVFEDYEGDREIKAIFLAEHQGINISDIPNQIDDMHLFEGSAVEYAEAYLDDTGLLETIPENLRYYFDTEALARDLVLSGDVVEVEIEGHNFIAEAW
jgi:hypothetical protein